MAKHHYYSEKLNTNDIKTKWKYTNELLGRSKEKKAIPNVMYDANENKFEGPKSIANEFNRFFTKVGLDPAEKFQIMIQTLL